MTAPTTPGWYEDPEDPDQLRYFDGILWSSHTTPRVTPSAPTRPEPTSSVPTGWGPAPGNQQPPGVGRDEPMRAGPGQQSPWSPPQAYGGQVGWGRPRRDTLPDGDVLAEWWRRLLGRIVDIVIIGTISAVVALVFFGPTITDALDPYIQQVTQAATTDSTVDLSAAADSLTAALLPISLVNLVVTVVYDTLFLVWRGATPGKMVLGTVVRPVEGPGPVGWARAVRRQLLYVVGDLVGLVPVVGVLGSMLSILDPAWLLWDSKRQALHDKVAGTVVVLRRR